MKQLEARYAAAAERSKRTHRRFMKVSGRRHTHAEFIAALDEDTAARAEEERAFDAMMAARAARRNPELEFIAALDDEVPA